MNNNSRTTDQQICVAAVVLFVYISCSFNCFSEGFFNIFSHKNTTTGMNIQMQRILLFSRINFSISNQL